MRSLRVSLYTPKPIILPLDYNELVQGLLYGCWAEPFPQLHDEGFVGDDGRTLRLFTFGRLVGPCTVDRKKRTVRFESLLSFEVRTPLEELLDALATRLSGRGTAQIGAYDDLRVVNLQSADRLLFPERARVRVTSPVVAYRTVDGRARFFGPTEPEWLEVVRGNAVRKARVLGLETSGELQVIPLTETLKRCWARFKRTPLVGWRGDLIVACDPTLLAALWCCGLGSKNSQGFGMFEIDERPL